MIDPTDVQIIKQNGRPAFAVVPYHQWIELTQPEPGNDDTYLPHAIVKLSTLEGLSLIAAWRKYRGISQSELAKHVGISQPALSQIESGQIKPSKDTLGKLADALDALPDQLTD